jgi:transposase-like protein
MTNTTPFPAAKQLEPTASAQLFDDWFDPIEVGIRARVRGFIQELIEAELEEALSRARYVRHSKSGQMSTETTSDTTAGATSTPAEPQLHGHRHGHRSRTLMGTFGEVEVSVPRARIEGADGKTTEWHSKALRKYQRRTKAADALIASTYLSGTNTRRVRRALATLFQGAVSKDTVSRVWRKVEGDWKAWNQRSLTNEPIVRLILDGTVVRVRLDKKATSICLLVVLGVREDGQKVLLSIKNMGGETAESWRVVLDDLIGRGLRKPEFLIVDGAAGLERALAEVWSDVATQRCTVHKHRNLLSHAPKRLRDEVSEDYNDMIYAKTAAEIEQKRRVFLRKWRIRCKAVADCLEEAGDRLFMFTRLPADQWKSARTTNAIERLHEEFKRRIKTQTVLPSAETAAMLFWALMASGQIVMRKVDGWRTLAVETTDLPIDLAA